MSKKSEQIIREVYSELAKGNYISVQEQLRTILRKSNDLPARCYTHGFKNMAHLMAVAQNQQHTQYQDLVALLVGMQTQLNKRSLKSLRITEEQRTYMKDVIRDLLASVPFAQNFMKDLGTKADAYTRLYGWHRWMHSYEHEDRPNTMCSNFDKFLVALIFSTNVVYPNLKKQLDEEDIL